METQELHRGRLIDHLQLVVDDLPAAQRFYGAIFEVLGVPMVSTDEFFYCDELFVSTKDSKAAAGKTTGRCHLAFQARDQKTVEAAYAAAIAAGGKDNGKPGPRPYHPGYYAGFVIDPAGNNLEIVFHGPAKRSADSVKITF